jgi:hypothetical protein
LAWDCGAITTGPATVPIVLALGFGMCRTRKQLKEDPHHDERMQALMTMLDRWAHHPKYQQIKTSHEAVIHRDQEYQALHDEAVDLPKKAKSCAAIGKGLTQHALRRSLTNENNLKDSMHASFLDQDYCDLQIENLVESRGQLSLEVDHSLFQRLDVKGEDLDCFGIVTLASLYPILTVLLFCIGLYFYDSPAQVTPAPTKLEVHQDGGILQQMPFAQMKEAFIPVATLVSFMLFLQFVVLREKLANVGRISIGVGSTFVGLTIFNIGLETGSVPLGDSSGDILPDALSEEFGLGVILAFGFITGVIATIIDLEPCGLGETVELLSNGKFTKRDLFVSVSLGVGTGIVIGMCKIIYHFNVQYVIFPGYFIALVLTHFSDDGITCVAWDSAGVTTGPVTVPLVLSMGVGICNKGYGTDGFGVLTCASVCPIVSVLLMGLYKLGPKSRVDADDEVAIVDDDEVPVRKCASVPETSPKALGI